MAWVDSNPELLADLEERPQILVDGVFKIRETQGLFRRWLSGSRRERPQLEATPLSRRPARTEAEQRRIEEARALVDAALGDADTPLTPPP
jgi:hypothetical protein